MCIAALYYSDEVVTPTVRTRTNAVHLCYSGDPIPRYEVDEIIERVTAQIPATASVRVHGRDVLLRGVSWDEDTQERVQNALSALWPVVIVERPPCHVTTSYAA